MTRKPKAAADDNGGAPFLDPARSRPQDAAVRGSGQADRLRIRAAWMYYMEQLTQNEIAERLGIGRVTVVRLLADARARN